jgi:hypothetical protein
MFTSGKEEFPFLTFFFPFSTLLPFAKFSEGNIVEKA